MIIGVVRNESCNLSQKEVSVIAKRLIEERTQIVNLGSYRLMSTWEVTV